MAFTSGTPTGQIAATDLQNEFGRGYSLSSYYGVARDVPTSGQIAYSDLRGKYRYYGGMRFQYQFVRLNFFNDRIEPRGAWGYGWRNTQVRNPQLNPGVDYRGSNGELNMWGDDSMVMEKLVWYYYRGWRLMIQTYRFPGGYYNQHYNTTGNPYRSGIRVSMNNGQFIANLPMGGFYRQVRGDLSRRYNVFWNWPTGLSFANYIDFQFYSFLG